jgi:hypothetical protein
MESNLKKWPPQRVENTTAHVLDVEAQIDLSYGLKIRTEKEVTGVVTAERVGMRFNSYAILTE